MRRCAPARLAACLPSLHALAQGLGHFPTGITETAPYVVAGLLLRLNVTRKALAFLVGAALLLLLRALIAVVGLLGAWRWREGPRVEGLLATGAILGLGWCLEEHD